MNLNNILGHAPIVNERRWLTDDDIIELVRYSPSAGPQNKVVDNAELRWAMVNEKGLKGDTLNLRRLVLPCNTSPPEQAGGNHWVVYSAQIYTRSIIVTRYNSFGDHTLERDDQVMQVIFNTFPGKIIELVPGRCAQQNDGYSCGHRVVRIIRALLLDESVPLAHTLEDTRDIARELLELQRG